MITMNTNILYTLDKHHHPDPLTHHGYLFIRGSSDCAAVMGIYQFQLQSAVKHGTLADILMFVPTFFTFLKELQLLQFGYCT